MLQRMSPGFLINNMDAYLYDLFGSVAPYRSRLKRINRDVNLEIIPVDVLDKHGGIVVVVDIPGKDEKSLRVELDGMKLTVESTKATVGDKDQNWLMRERPSGIFKRSIKLPVAVDSHKVSSTYRNGVLEIVLPKQDQYQVKEIAIN